VQNRVADAIINGEFRAHFLGLEEAEKRKEILLFTDNLGFFKPFQTRAPRTPLFSITFFYKLLPYKV